MNKRQAMTAMLVALSWTTALSQVQPRSSRGFAHEQVADYRAGQAVRVLSSPGYQVLIELAPDERVQSTALGDLGAWQVTSDQTGNNIFVKPLVADRTTNLSVITNVRRYSFILIALRAPSSRMPYAIRFRYGQAAGLQAVNPATQSQAGVMYKISGFTALRPRDVRDDGVHTYIDWAPETDLPAVYRLDQLGRETLANGYMRENLYVLDDVADHLLFRVDKHVARADRRVQTSQAR